MHSKSKTALCLLREGYAVVHAMHIKSISFIIAVENAMIVLAITHVQLLHLLQFRVGETVSRRVAV
jgi:hypothetical protein